MKNSWSATLLAVLVGAAVSVSDVFACSNCSPTMPSTYNSSPSISVFLDGSLTQQERQAASNGIAMWNQWFTSNGFSAPFYIVTYGPASVTVTENSSLGTDPGGVDPTHHWIYLNPLYNTRTDGLLTDVMGHEFGHILGFNDKTDTFCFPYTIMHQGINTSSGPYLTTLGSADGCALAQYFAPQAPQPSPTPVPGADVQNWGYNASSPIVLNLGHGGYQLSGVQDPVFFDINASGFRVEMTWTALGSEMAFLALDRNGNGRIDDGSELFGDQTRMENGTRAPNGFEALKEFDANGDGIIDARDPVWSKLVLWTDRNHDGFSTPDEVLPVADSEVTAISVAHHWTGRRDQSGNTFRYEGRAVIRGENRPIYDVWFLVRR